MGEWNFYSFSLMALSLMWIAISVNSFSDYYFSQKQNKVIAPVINYEETKLYAHEVQKALQKYYPMYKTANKEGRKAIRDVIRMRFYKIDSALIQSEQLRLFLIEVRSY